MQHLWVCFLLNFICLFIVWLNFHNTILRYVEDVVKKYPNLFLSFKHRIHLWNSYNYSNLQIQIKMQLLCRCVVWGQFLFMHKDWWKRIQLKIREWLLWMGLIWKSTEDRYLGFWVEMVLVRQHWLIFWLECLILRWVLLNYNKKKTE